MTTRMKIMRQKISEAYELLRKSQKECNEAWRNYKRVTPRGLHNEFENIFKDTVKQTRKNVQKTSENKISWLKGKWKEKPKELPSEIRGINLEECNINEIDNHFDANPREYGNVEISSNERKLLELPPKFGLMEKVDTTECMINVERVLNQIRWKRNIGENENESRKFLYDHENKTININNLRATDLHYNTDVKMPDPVSFEEEIQFQNFKKDMKELAIKMEKKSKNCSNLDDDEKDGLRTIKEKVKKEEAICFMTDKSGRWGIDTKENYMLACEKHFTSGVEEITPTEHDDIEKYLNCQMLALC